MSRITNTESCPITGEASSVTRSLRDFSWIDCPSCGRFGMSGDAEFDGAGRAAGDWKAALGRARHRYRSGSLPVILPEDFP